MDQTRTVGLILLTLGLFFGISGYFDQHPGSFNFGEFVADFYANASAELLSIAITVLIIDRLNRRRDERQRALRDEERMLQRKVRDEQKSEEEQADHKARLIREMGGRDRGLAYRAVRELEAYDWLTDGSLRGADLREANLVDCRLVGVQMPDANLRQANLRGVNLMGANLSGVDLSEANLVRANLRETNLAKATLSGQGRLSSTKLAFADLSGANLTDAVVSDGQLRLVKLMPGTIMPDGRRYEEWNEDEIQAIRVQKQVRGTLRDALAGIRKRAAGDES
ncbi:MAG: pentapeptide repeat-containing protein [Anaerolineaceae bacterium]|nr:MAG: pentapeptide repeat-containing protein [Anaerolineaceae bacterium]